jgi:hypothetical protein
MLGQSRVPVRNRYIANPLFRKPCFLIAAPRGCPGDTLIGARRVNDEDVAQDLLYFGGAFRQHIGEGGFSIVGAPGIELGPAN